MRFANIGIPWSDFALFLSKPLSPIAIGSWLVPIIEIYEVPWLSVSEEKAVSFSVEGADRSSRNMTSYSCPLHFQKDLPTSIDHRSRSRLIALASPYSWSFCFRFITLNLLL